MTTTTTSESPKMLTVRIADDLSVCVPDDIRLMTPYILLEQEDWFEDDIHFVRQLVQPGDHIIDIGANYGIYTLSMAHAAGDSGRVWAIDPSQTTMRHLEKSVAANRFGQVALIHAGLSDQAGKAYLPREDNPELGAVVTETRANQPCDEIDLLTLDECEQRYGWHNICFIKMDAEGHESRILQGGKHFLAVQSPLIMYEIKAGKEFNHSLIGEFASLGYQSYRLLPRSGKGMLVPVDSARTALDAYVLNLFCCKADRVAELNARGLLCQESVQAAASQETGTAWQAVIAGEMHSAAYRAVWEQSAGQRDSQPGWLAHRRALNHYALSRDGTLEACAQASHLRTAFDLLADLVRTDASLPRLLTFVRVATEWGRRSVAVNVLQELVSILARQPLPVATEPFLAPSSVVLPVGSDLAQWQARIIAETCIRLGSYSDYFSGVANLSLLDALHGLGGMSPEMQRRRQLIRMRMGSQQQPERSAALTQRSAENRNPEFWIGNG